MEAKRCCNRVYRSGHAFGGSPCAKKAKVERDGKHYCTVHDPVRVKEKSDARTAKWQAEWTKERTEREEAEALKAEMKRRYDCHDALVSALRLARSYMSEAVEYESPCAKRDAETVDAALALAGETT